MAEKLSELVQVRVTPGLLAGLQAEAERLHLRLPDVVRVVLAEGVAHQLMNDGSICAR